MSSSSTARLTWGQRSSRRAARETALSAIGLRPLRFTWLRVTEEGAEVIAELEATLARRHQSSTPSSRSTLRRIASEEA